VHLVPDMAPAQQRQYYMSRIPFEGMSCERWMELGLEPGSQNPETGLPRMALNALEKAGKLEPWSTTTLAHFRGQRPMPPMPPPRAAGAPPAQLVFPTGGGRATQESKDAVAVDRIPLIAAYGKALLATMREREAQRRERFAAAKAAAAAGQVPPMPPVPAAGPGAPPAQLVFPTGGGRATQESKDAVAVDRIPLMAAYGKTLLAGMRARAAQREAQRSAAAAAAAAAAAPAPMELG